MDFRDFEAPKSKKPAAKAKGFGSPSADAKDAAPEAAPLTPERLQHIVGYNSWGNDHNELGIASMRGESLTKCCIGLWPEFAMLNHSCIPNTENFAVGGALLVRSNMYTPAGAEVTTNYLGECQLTSLVVCSSLATPLHGSMTC